MCSFVCLFVRLCVHLLALSFVRLFVCPFVPIFVCSFVCLFVRLCVHLLALSFVRLFVCPFVSIFVCSFVCPFVRSLVLEAAQTCQDVKHEIRFWEDCFFKRKKDFLLVLKRNKCKVSLLKSFD